MNEENIVFNSEDVQNNKVMGILAYFGILFLIPLLAAKDSQYARFHTNQGILLFIFSVALNIIGNGISFVISVDMQSSKLSIQKADCHSHPARRALYSPVSEKYPPPGKSLPPSKRR